MCLGFDVVFRWAIEVAALFKPTLEVLLYGNIKSNTDPHSAESVARTADASVSELGLHGRRRPSMVIDRAPANRVITGESNSRHQNRLRKGGLHITQII